MNTNLKNRLKNYGLWMSLASLLLIALQLFGVPVVPGQYTVVVNAILAALSGLGIISNPTTDHVGYLDDQPQAPELP